MRGLEPGVIHLLAVLMLQFAEAHERMHLVNFAIDGLRHLGCVMHVGVRGILEQSWLSERAPCKAIHELPATGVSMACDAFEQIDELA
jgi:hypothetical protein